MIGALELYAARLGEPAGAQLRARLLDGPAVRLPVERWLSRASPEDEAVLDRARGPVIDLGCGPGRHLHALAARGIFALGVDVSPAAVRMARTRGARAIEASVFDELPGAGRWRTALLLDGNIGIGGQPVALLRRIATLLAADGQALIELEPPRVITATVQARLELAGGRSDWFRWARVGAGDVGALARQAGFRVAERWCGGRRWFARLEVDSGATVVPCEGVADAGRERPGAGGDARSPRSARRRGTAQR